MRFLCWAAIGLWIVTAAAATYAYVATRPQMSADGRTALDLAPQERAIVLGEMRTMLGSVRGIVAAAADGDMEGVREAAHASGNVMQRTVPAELMLKLPGDFKQKGFAVHSAFDEIAVAAQQRETVEMILMRLGEQLDRCVGCHAEYLIK
jgi:hypothetical protein